MILNEAVQEAINAQINNELFSMYSYLSMSAYCEHKQFRGCAIGCACKARKSMATRCGSMTF